MLSGKAILAILLLAQCCAIQALQKRYTGDQVYRLVPTTEEQLGVIRQFLDGNSEIFDFWSEPSFLNEPVDVRVDAQWTKMFSEIMSANTIPSTVLIPDVQKMIDEVAAKDARKSDRAERSSIVGTFATYDEVNAWIAEMCATHSDKATCGDVGTSYENRTIKYIKLGVSTGATKQKIWLEGTMHAREWLGTATVVYIIDRMLNSYATDPDAKRMLDTYDWWVIPISNPDGYEYSHNSERLWRKNRRKNEGSRCYGVDPNRNWDYQWGTGGSSTNPCSDTYRGTGAFSEPETKAISDFVLANKDNTRIYYSIHTYSQLWLLPYGVTPKPDDYDELMRVGEIGKTALEAVNSKRWKIGTIVDLLYVASGGSIDWAKGAVGFTYSYCLELRPSQFSIGGFVVSKDEIDPSGREVWAGLIAGIDAVPDPSN